MGSWPRTLPQAYAWTSAILVDEFNTGAFESYLNCLNRFLGHMTPHLFEIDNRRES
jgi:hypothetical protein